MEGNVYHIYIYIYIHTYIISAKICVQVVYAVQYLYKARPKHTVYVFRHYVKLLLRIICGVYAHLIRYTYFIDRN